jgi:UDP-N-acetyl-D-galactosamine dehydrogenase
MSAQREHTIAILGLGYVGLPLAVAFSKKYKTLGFDINAEKATLIASGVDPTNELDGDQLSHALQSQLQITSDPALLALVLLSLLQFRQILIRINPQP